MALDLSLQRFDRLPLVAILRGLTVAEAEPVTRAVLDAGFLVVEVPLSQPESLRVLERMVAASEGRAVVGAGTVLRVAQVEAVAAVGGTLAVSPNSSVEVIRRTVELGLLSMPGVATPTEAMTALDAGAHALKLFPGEAFPPAVLKSWRSVFSPPIRLCPVGGVTLANAVAHRRAGATGFGLGGSIYRPGMDPAQVGANARAWVDAWRQQPDVVALGAGPG